MLRKPKLFYLCSDKANEIGSEANEIGSEANEERGVERTASGIKWSMLAYASILRGEDSVGTQVRTKGGAATGDKNERSKTCSHHIYRGPYSLGNT